MKVNVVYFSPCNNTGQIAKMVGAVLANKLYAGYEEADVTLPAMREAVYHYTDKEILVIASPVYAGRIPNKILPFFKDNIVCDGTIVVPIVSFGNRNFDNALKELCEICVEKGGKIAGCAAIVSEHVFSKKLATDRPDNDDRSDITTFAQEVADFIERSVGNGHHFVGNHDFESLPLELIPGEPNVSQYYTPLSEDGSPANFLKAHPNVLKEKCVGCMRCVNLCPMGSIDDRDPAKMNGICIKCQACIKGCYSGARYFDDESFLSHVKYLENHYSEPNVSCFITG